jgi:hypothetical protein
MQNKDIPRDVFVSLFHAFHGGLAVHFHVHPASQAAAFSLNYV